MRIISIIRAAATALLLCALASATGTLTGNFTRPMTSQGLVGAVLNLTLSQYGIAGGSYAIVPQSVSCYTSTAGAVVGLPDPTVTPIVTPSAASGSLPSGNYFVRLAYVASGVTTLTGPEIAVNLASPGQLTITAPVLQPASASGYAVYIGTSSGAETLQGAVTGWSSYIQSSALSAGSALPGTNTSVCSFTFNDSIIPTNTYYTATLLDATGTPLPGFPQNWYLAGSTVNVATIVPLAQSPAVGFPQPVLQNPTSITAQSVNSALNLNSHAVDGTSNLGPGLVSAFYNTTLPASGTIFTWTPNVAVTLTRLSASALTAGGASGASTLAVTDGTNTCTFGAILNGSATSGSSQPTGMCSFSAGVQLSLKVTSDTHSPTPANINFVIEGVSQ